MQKHVGERTIYKSRTSLVVTIPSGVLPLLNIEPGDRAQWQLNDIEQRRLTLTIQKPEKEEE